MINNNYEKLQVSKSDVRHIYNQIYASTSSKLDLHLPTSNNDLLKKNVASHLDEFLVGVFEMAANALTVDGKELGPNSNESLEDILQFEPSEQTEPFDFELNGELRKLLQQVEEETVQLSKLRRNMPERIGSQYHKLVERTDKEVTELLGEMDNITTDDNELEIDDLGSKNYEQALIRLNALKQTIPKRKMEIEKINDTIAFLEKLNAR